MRLVVVVGPTASGKSALALDLARASGGEIISADSQQVYRGMDIGTGKLPVAERAGVPHHLIDVVDPDDTMTAARFVGLADAVLADLERRAPHTPVIVAGGTGLYVRALLHGLFEGPGADAALRARLSTQGAPALLARLTEVDPESAGRILPNDTRRLIRALEVFELTGRPISALQREHDVRRAPARYRARWIGLAPPRDELHRRIEARVDAMLAAGLIDEVRGLADRYPLDLRAFDAIGYREAREVLRGTLDPTAAPAHIKAATRRYARRQLGWFRSEPAITWYNARGAVDLASHIEWLRVGRDD
jgi:tRNA dimethylallyltransferase